MSQSEAATRRPRRTALGATLASLVSVLVWWGGVLWLDGANAERLPSHQYETIAWVARQMASRGWIF